MQNRCVIFKWKMLKVVLWFSVNRETIKIKFLILWFWSKAKAPTQETHHSEYSVYIGNTSICAPTSSISFLCLPMLFSHSLLPSPISLSCPSLCLSLSFLLLPLLHCLHLVSVFLFCIHPPSWPPSPLLLCIPQYPPGGESSIFIGEPHMLFWQ